MEPITLDQRALTVEEVAELLRVSKATVLRWKKESMIPGFFKLGRRWLIRKEDLDLAVGSRIKLLS